MKNIVDYDDLNEYLYDEGIIDIHDTLLYVGYSNANDDYNEFHITKIRECDKYGPEYIEAFCIDKDGEREDKYRTFKIDRFNWIDVVNEVEDADEDDEDEDEDADEDADEDDADEEYTDFCRYLKEKGISEIENALLLVGYTNAYGVYNEFRITDISHSIEYGSGYIEAYCIDKDGEREDKYRTFKINRFDYINILD